MFFYQLQTHLGLIFTLHRIHGIPMYILTFFFFELVGPTFIGPNIIIVHIFLVTREKNRQNLLTHI